MSPFVLTLLLASAPDPERLPVIKPAPAVRLTDVSGKRFDLEQCRGKVVLVGFIFTTCSGTCPATTHRMARVQQELARHPGLAEQVQLVSITLDPERDTPEKLRDYMALYDIDRSNWSFLTGPKQDVHHAVAAWGMWARPAANGQLDHPSRVYLVDPAGSVREIYNLEFLRVPWVIEDMQMLLRAQ